MGKKPGEVCRISGVRGRRQGLWALQRLERRMEKEITKNQAASFSSVD
jgi:hypothetical protein